MKGPKLLGLALRNLLSRPATIEYPREKTIVESDFRGLQYADLTRCTGCSLCALECPADAIKMIAIPREYEVPKTNPRRIYPLVNYGKCIYCYRCVKMCPVNAYIVTNRFNMAGPTKLSSEGLSLGTLKKVQVG